MPLLGAMSCNYKDRRRNAFYLYVCNGTYCGLCARINIIQGENGAPRIEISDDWDAAFD